MRLFHTSDWHLGRSFYGSRHIEVFSSFLDWLSEQIESQKVNILLVAGDVFDTVTPGNRSQELYYQFLSRIAGSCCRHVVITAGNHDSPSFLEAPKALLRHMRIHVIGTPSEDPKDEVIVLYDENNQPEAIVCAVPYLRDRDIRCVAADESVKDKNDRLLSGIRDHYERVCATAEQIRKQIGEIPLIVMGHLFTAGGRTVADDGVRDLYVGSLAHVPADMFPDGIDYLALGHLHSAQQAGSRPHFCYCGSPIPMGFGEAQQIKKILRVDFDGRKPTVTECPVPCFQPLARICGQMDEICEQLEWLKSRQPTALIEVDYTGAALQPNLKEEIEAIIADTEMEIKCIRNRQITDRVLAAMKAEETLATLDVYDVFQRCLEQNEVPEEEQHDLMLAYREIVSDLCQADVKAEG
ncbi:MAG: exonuclease SbcCD subunit D C-terminal domain-containing protein [Clostridia bacterium]|nr:exonuclease SbcCD subunit D C-terminal domain-containing protein [Clostridia bacterium]